MALWGQGDPRWIVEMRDDGRNVNNWHWTTKNCSGWSKDKITNLLNEVKIEDSIGYVKIDEISSIDGEAEANNRKAKLIFFFEWNIKGKWSGKLADGEHEIKGNFEIPNLSEENEPNEIDVNVSYAENQEHDKNEQIKNLFRTKATDLIRNQLAIYIKELKENYAKDLILPTKENSNEVVKPDSVKSVTKINKTPVFQTNKDKDSLNDLRTLTFEEEFKCTSSDFYNALTVEQLLSMFTNSKAESSNCVGGKFSLFEGNVEGIYTELVKDKLIKQKWRFKSWPAEHYSDVTFEIETKDDCIVCKLKQENIPANDYERTKEGWKRYYFEMMRRVLGFGSSLY